MSTDNVTPIKQLDSDAKLPQPPKRRGEKSACETLRFRESRGSGICADLLLVALKYQFLAIEKILDTEQDATAASYLALAGQQLITTLEERQIT